MSYLKTIGEAVGIIAVVASIYFPGLEIKQGNDIARATIHYDLVASWNAFQDLVIGDPVAADLVNRTGQEDAAFTPVEQTRIRAFANRIFNARDSVRFAYEGGLIDRPS